MTIDGQVWTQVIDSRAEVRDRREDDPELALSPKIKRSGSISRKLKTLHFRCTECPLDYQRQGESWREIAKAFHEAGFRYLDLSKLPM